MLRWNRMGALAALSVLFLLASYMIHSHRSLDDKGEFSAGHSFSIDDKGGLNHFPLGNDLSKEDWTDVDVKLAVTENGTMLTALLWSMIGSKVVHEHATSTRKFSLSETLIAQFRLNGTSEDFTELESHADPCWFEKCPVEATVPCKGMQWNPHGDGYSDEKCGTFENPKMYGTLDPMYLKLAGNPKLAEWKEKHCHAPPPDVVEKFKFDGKEYTAMSCSFQMTWSGNLCRLDYKGEKPALCDPSKSASSSVDLLATMLIITSARLAMHLTL